MELEKAIDALKLELKCQLSDNCQDCGSCPYFLAPQLRIDAIEVVLNTVQGMLDKQKKDPEIIRETNLLDSISAGYNLTQAAELIGVSKGTASRILKKAIEQGRVPSYHRAMLIHKASGPTRKKKVKT